MLRESGSRDRRRRLRARVRRGFATAAPKLPRATAAQTPVGSPPG